MARKKMVKRVGVEVIKSFDLYRQGEVWETILDDRTLALISGGFLEVRWHGESSPGSGATDEGDSGGGTEGDSAEGSAGFEPGADSGAGGHGPATGVGSD